MSKENAVCTEAVGLVYGDRAADYGHPLDEYTRLGEMWSAIIGAPVSAEQAVLCMVALKVNRERNKPKRDNRVDIAGYAECLQKMADERDVRAGA